MGPGPGPGPGPGQFRESEQEDSIKWLNQQSRHLELSKSGRTLNCDRRDKVSSDGEKNYTRHWND